MAEEPNEVESLRKELKDLEAQANAELKNWQEKLILAKSESADLQSELDESQKQFYQLKEQMASVQQLAEEREKELDALKAANSTTAPASTTELEIQLEKMESELKALQAEKVMWETEKEDRAPPTGAVAAQVANHELEALKEVRVELEHRVGVLEDRVAHAESAESKALERAAQWERKYNEQGDHVKLLTDGKVMKTMDEVAVIEHAKMEAEASLGDARRNIDQMQVAVSQLREGEANWKREAESARQRASDLEKELVVARTDCTTLEGERARLEGERARLEGERARLEGEHGRMEGELHTERSERSGLSQELGVLQGEFGKLKQSFTELNASNQKSLEREAQLEAHNREEAAKFGKREATLLQQIAMLEARVKDAPKEEKKKPSPPKTSPRHSSVSPHRFAPMPLPSFISPHPSPPRSLSPSFFPPARAWSPGPGPGPAPVPGGFQGGSMYPPRQPYPAPAGAYPYSTLHRSPSPGARSASPGRVPGYPAFGQPPSWVPPAGW